MCRARGHHGWLVLTAFIVAWDLIAAETLSFAFARGIAHRRWRWAVTAAWVLVTCHLFSPRRTAAARNR